MMNFRHFNLLLPCVLFKDLLQEKTPFRIFPLMSSAFLKHKPLLTHQSGMQDGMKASLVT